MPGELRISKFVLNNTNDSLLVRFAFPSNTTGVALVVYLQYGKAPTSKQFDVKFNMSQEYNVTVERDKSVNCGNVTAKNDRRACCRVVSKNGFHCYNFDNFTHAYKNNREVWFGITYEGAMPPKTIISNPFTFDEVEVTNTMNFTQQLITPSCKYWNENMSRYESDGLKVS